MTMCWRCCLKFCIIIYHCIHFWNYLFCLIHEKGILFYVFFLSINFLFSTISIIFIISFFKNPASKLFFFFCFHFRELSIYLYIISTIHIIIVSNFISRFFYIRVFYSFLIKKIECKKLVKLEIFLKKS